MSDRPEYESTSDARKGMPRWLRLTLIIVGVLIVVAVVMMVVGGGHRMGGMGAGTVVPGLSVGILG